MTLTYPLSIEQIQQNKNLLEQIEYLNRLDKAIQSIFGETDSSPLDKSINDLLNSFLYFSHAEERCSGTQIDEIIDTIFNGQDYDTDNKFDEIMNIIFTEGGDEE